MFYIHLFLYLSTHLLKTINFPIQPYMQNSFQLSHFLNVQLPFPTVRNLTSTIFSTFSYMRNLLVCNQYPTSAILAGPCRRSSPAQTLMTCQGLYPAPAPHFVPSVAAGLKCPGREEKRNRQRKRKYVPCSPRKLPQPHLLFLSFLLFSFPFFFFFMLSL